MIASDSKKGKIMKWVALGSVAAVMTIGLIHTFESRASMSPGYVLVECKDSAGNLGCVSTSEGANCGLPAACP